MNNEKSKPAGGDYDGYGGYRTNAHVADLEKKINQLQYVINHLQTRFGQIAASYEVEIAIAKSELHVEKLYGEEEVD
jgi:hypothetical protein